MTKTDQASPTDFRPLMQVGAALVLPGVANALAARVVADLGFKAAYISGAGIANSYLGIPDNGLVTMTELIDHVATIRDVFPGAIMVDADTGFGNAMNTARAIRLLERAGTNAIQLEDQVFPKRCGHFDGKEVIPKAEMVSKITAAVDARHDTRTLIVARTDAIATLGFDDAIDRAQAYRNAGADVTFVEAPTTAEHIAEIPKRLPWPQLINIVIGGRTPELSNDKLKSMGYAAALYANVALQAAVHGMQLALRQLRDTRNLGNPSNFVVDFAERQRIVGKTEFDVLEQKYAALARGL